MNQRAIARFARGAKSSIFPGKIEQTVVPSHVMGLTDDQLRQFAHGKVFLSEWAEVAEEISDDPASANIVERMIEEISDTTRREGVLALHNYYYKAIKRVKYGKNIRWQPPASPDGGDTASNR